VDITYFSFIKNRVIVTGSFHEGLLAFNCISEAYLAKCWSEGEVVQTNVAEKNEIHIFFPQYALSMRLAFFKMHKQTRIPVLFRGTSKVTMHIFSSKLT
jgi:hypothetical protein